ncbi:hypothetical protein [Mucilaginibacter sp. OK098]|nr:hypothetical protein [Mucilaginibacter sp. OK098]
MAIAMAFVRDGIEYDILALEFAEMPGLVKVRAVMVWQAGEVHIA